MEELKSFLLLYSWMGIMGICIVLVVTAVLRWLAKEKTRARRLNQLAVLALGILCVMFLFSMRDTVTNAFTPTVDGSAVEDIAAAADSSAAESTTPAAKMLDVFVQVSRLTAMVLLLGVVTASLILLILVITLFLWHGIKAVFAAGTQADEDLKEKLKAISQRLITIMKSPVFTAAITWGILALLIFMPLLMGNSDNGSVAERWVDGVYKIAAFGEMEQSGVSNRPQDQEQGADASSGANAQPDDTGTDSNSSSESNGQNSGNNDTYFYQALIKCMLLAVIVLGVAFAAFRLLYSIISRTLTESRSRELIDEYSGAIGVLSVGVAMLWTLQGEVSLKGEPFKLLFEFLKAFSAVMILVALVVLTLEIIRLLLDMRETLIRQEARLLFISLIGQVSLLVLSMLNAIYDAINGTLGNPDDDALEQVQQRIKAKIVEAMDKQMDKTKEHKRTFAGFDEVVIKKDEEEGF